MKALPIAMVAGVTLYGAVSAVAQIRPAGIERLVSGGIDDCQNEVAWSMAWFQNRLFVGTGRGTGMNIPPGPEQCVIEDAAAEIWRYTPDLGRWERVYKSPRDTISSASTPALRARENGFRDMLVFEEADGTKALYVAGVIFPAENGETRRPRILRSLDGETFVPLPQDRGTFLGDLDVDGFRAFAAYKDRLFVTAGAVSGQGVLLEAQSPAWGNDAFQQVGPTDLRIFEMEVFNDHLYVGTAEALGQGFSVGKTAAEGTPPYAFETIVAEGGYPECTWLLGLLTLCPNNAVLSMAVYRNQLYIGGNTDILRINPDDSWDVVVGNARHTPDGLKTPLSGLGTGFGNFFTGHVWRLGEHQGRLYAGTWDFAIQLRKFPILRWLAWPEYGCDLWMTGDGAHWIRVNRNGLGNGFNLGLRTMLSTPDGLYLGTVNPWDGAEIWRLSSD